MARANVVYLKAFRPCDHHKLADVNRIGKVAKPSIDRRFLRGAEQERDQEGQSYQQNDGIWLNRCRQLAATEEAIQANDRQREPTPCNRQLACQTAKIE